MDRCTVCKKALPDGPPETWITPDGDSVTLALSIECSVLADTSVGEFEICEECYRRGLPPYFTPEDMAEIHYQFGLEYRMRDMFARSAEALTQAHHIRETADILAALALAESDLGHREVAKDLYRRAIKIEPSHFMARENLRQLNDSAI